MLYGSREESQASAEREAFNRAHGHLINMMFDNVFNQLHNDNYAFNQAHVTGPGDLINMMFDNVFLTNPMMIIMLLTNPMMIII